MPPKRRRRFQGLYYHSSPPKVLPMNGQITNSNGRRRRDPDDLSVKLSTIRIWMHEKDIGKLTRVLWAGQGNRLRQQASTNPRVKRFLAAVPYVMNSIKDVHQAVIDNSLENLQANLEPPVPPALITCRDANGLNLIHKAAGLGHATILEYLINIWPDGVHETDITGKTPLHWAASAKNNMRCYTLLTQAGCDEEAVDYKMKTPSFYRHKPHEIERSFLTFVPEAPRVSPDVATDWEALSDESGDGKKLDIKIPEMNGFGRHSNAGSNTSEAEMTEAASGQEDEDMSKDGDAPEENNEAEAENEDEKEPETKDENEGTEEPAAEEEAKEETEAAEHEETQENQEQEEEQKEPEEKEDEPQDEKLQTDTLNDTTTANLSKDSKADDDDDHETTESSQDHKENVEEKELKEKESADHKEESDKENLVDQSKDSKESETEAKEETPEEKDLNEEKKESKESDDQKDNVEEVKETKVEEKTSEKEIVEKTEDSSNEKSNNVDKGEENLEEKLSEQDNVKESKEVSEEKSKDSLEALKDDKDQDETKSEEGKVKEDDKKEKEELSNAEEGKEKEDEQKDKEVLNAADEGKEKEDEYKDKEDKEDSKASKENEKSDDDLKTEKKGEENIDNGSDEKKENDDVKDNDDSKTLGEALVDIKDEVKDNVKYLANQLKNVFSDKTKDKDEKNGDNNSESKTAENKDEKEIEKAKLENNETKEEITDSEAHTKTIADEKPKENGEIKQSPLKESSEINDDVQNEKEKSATTPETSAPNTADSIETKDNDQPKTPPKTSDSIISQENSNSSNDQEPPKTTQTPPSSTAPKTPPKESPKKANDKTEEDENNNTSNMTNQTETNSTTQQKETASKPSTAEAAIDDQFKELNKSLEEYKKSQTSLEETEKTLGDKLEEMADNLKDNVKEITDKVVNVFSNTKDNQDNLDNETNDIVVHGDTSRKSTPGKKLLKDHESSDDTADEDEETRIQNIIASGDMEQLAQIVLNGDGQKLLNIEAQEPEIQAFLRNVPNYMGKIKRVHEAARNGSLLNLQQALDRRKFAIAKDEISPNGATPLHVAVLFGNSDIVRYLSARFPETTTITDEDGRTALHYAAVINDNGHFYNVLLQLGANPKVVDKMGHTPEDYLSKEELKDTLNYGQLLKRFGAEELEEQLLSDQGQIENQSCQENPIFKTEQGKYLADNLADPLIKALTQVAHKRPTDPLQYLTNYLQSFVASRNTNGRTITQAAIHSGSSQTNSTRLATSKPSTPAQIRQSNQMNGHVKYANADNIEEDPMQQVQEFEGDDDDDSDSAMSRKLEERDEHGQSMLHFACARSHRKGGLIHLIEEAKADITYRDELYRTARDVALQANQLGNAKEIDRYVMSLAIVGDIKPFEHFAISGYDHIIDVLDDNETPIIDVVEARGLHELAAYLKTIRPLEELREELHQMIRDNKVERVKEIADGPSGKWLIKAKNYYGRTALHIAILKESVEIVEYFIKLCPEVLKIGDNLERTPLHYAMGTNIIESISRILIQNGAKRTYKDLKGRQPSYYFMNKADILRLQEEEDENR